MERREGVARRADRRGWGRSCRALAIALVAFGCGGGGSSAPSSPAEPTSGPAEERASTTGAEVAPTPALTELAGAAAQPPEPDVPEDTTDLASRMAPRRLIIPATRTGQTSRFTFDGFRRGFLARLPNGPQALVTPVYGQGKVYLGGGFSSHQFFAYDARTGERAWTVSAPDGGPTAAIIEDGKVLFNTESCTLFAVDAETGRTAWSRWLGDPLMGQPAAAGGLVFSGHIVDERSPGNLTPGVTGFGTGGGRRYGFTAMRVSNGAPRWTRAISADVMNAPVLDDESVFITTMDGVVWRFDRATGRLHWRRSLRATSAPWLDGETLHVSVRARGEGRERLERAVLLAKANGETRQEHEPVHAAFLRGRPDAAGVPAGWAYEGSRATLVDGRLYQTIGDEVHCRDADSGELLWRRRYASETRGRPATPPAVAGSQLVFGTEAGVLYGLDIDTGLTTWAYEVGEPIAAQPTVAHGWVYAATTRGGLVGLEVSDASFDGWHMWGGNARHNGPVEGSAPPVEDETRPTEGTLQLGTAPRDGEAAGFLLRSTRVNASVSGFVARVSVEQTFENPYERPVEAVYLFPLPDDAAVDAMQMRAGARVVHAVIRRREQAQEEYRDARERGVLASLLEQERPNLFRQSVANIRPGDTISVTLSYTQALPYAEGSYRFVYPMVAGPRHQPDAEGEGEGAGPRQIVLAPGAERPDRVEVTVEADLGMPIREVSSPTHALEVSRRGDRRARVALAEAARPDRDLDVRFRVAGDAPEVAVLASPPSTDERGHFSLALHPSLELTDSEIMARELVFVVDTSSSMHGRPMEMARAAMLRALEGLRPTDTFRVLSFSDRTSALSDAPLPATPENVARATRFVRDLRALGATEMLSGLRAALEPEAQDDRMRVVLLMTDGYIGNETEIFRAVNERLGHARLFPFGVGSAVNRYLLTRLAEIGRGESFVVTLDESPEAAADGFHARIARPNLTDLSIDWGGLEVADAYPRRLPDLYADRPLVVHARYASGASGEVTVRGRVAGQPFAQTFAVNLPAEGAPRPELTSVWARTRIRDLMTAMALRPSDTLREEVTELGLRHHLLTEWTAFLAIDEGYRVDAPATPVNQPAALPAGIVAPPRPPAPAAIPRRTASSVTRSAVGGGMAAPSAEAADLAWGSPRERQRARPDRPQAGGRGAGPDCYALARRPDGTIDQAALEACLRAQGGGARKSVDENKDARLRAPARGRTGNPLGREASTTHAIPSWRHHDPVRSRAALGRRHEDREL